MTDELKTHTFHIPEGDTPACWETAVWCRDGSVQIGFGETADESKKLALQRADKHHAFLSSNAKDRLKQILLRAPGSDYLLAADVTHAIRALAEIVLGESRDG